MKTPGRFFLYTTSDASFLERETGGVVYALYGLTPEEIKIVEGSGE